MPKAVSRIDAASLDDARGALRETFGFENFLPGQAEIVEAVLSGRDVLAVMPTGSGKSLLYQLPAAMRIGLVVVVSPLISLMREQKQYPARARQVETEIATGNTKHLAFLATKADIEGHEPSPPDGLKRSP